MFVDCRIMNYKFDWDRENALVTFNGPLTYDDIRFADRDLFGDPRFDHMKFIVYDFLAADELIITDHDLVVTAAINKSASYWNKELKMALVSDKQQILDSIQRFIDLMKGSNWKIRSFTTLEEAFEWV